MSRIRTLFISIALGLAMIAFVPLTGSAQSTNNPSTTPSAEQPVGAATGQPPSSAVGSTTTAQAGNPQQQTPAAGDTPNPTPNTNSSANSMGAVGNGSASDQQTIGTTGENAPARTGHGSTAGLIALIVLAVIVVIAFTTIRSNRSTVTHNRTS